jgi:oligopeptide transport system substrate-binding protein
MGIENWNAVVNGELPYEELGVEVVDDYTFTITTERPVPFLIKIMADIWVVPEHVVQDRDNDGSWALDEENWVFAGPYKLVEYNKGVNMKFEANEMYSGPFPPLLDKHEVIFMEPETRFNAYKNDELGVHGWRLRAGPSALGHGRNQRQSGTAGTTHLLAQLHHLLPLLRHVQ